MVRPGARVDVGLGRTVGVAVRIGVGVGRGVGGGVALGVGLGDRVGVGVGTASTTVMSPTDRGHNRKEPSRSPTKPIATMRCPVSKTSRVAPNGA